MRPTFPSIEDFSPLVLLSQLRVMGAAVEKERMLSHSAAGTHTYIINTHTRIFCFYFAAALGFWNIIVLDRRENKTRSLSTRIHLPTCSRGFLYFIIPPPCVWRIVVEFAPWSGLRYRGK